MIRYFPIVHLSFLLMILCHVPHSKAQVSAVESSVCEQDGRTSGCLAPGSNRLTVASGAVSHGAPTGAGIQQYGRHPDVSATRADVCECVDKFAAEEPGLDKGMGAETAINSAVSEGSPVAAPAAKQWLSAEPGSPRTVSPWGEEPPELKSLGLSDDIVQLLKSGMELPLLLRNVDAEVHDKDLVIADIKLLLLDDALYLQQLIWRERPDGPQLSTEFKEKILAGVGKELDERGRLVLSDHEQLHFNMLTFKAELWAAPGSFSARPISHRYFLAAPKSRQLGNIFQYSANGYFSQNQGKSTSSHFLQFNNLTGWDVNSITLSGSLNQASGDNRKSLNIDRALYSRDFGGRTLSLGMLESWSIQSLGNVSTLDSNRLYGFSYGNVSRSVMLDRSQSLIPVTVYLASAGDVRILRDGRLLNVQQMEMGNHNLDTSMLPNGLYDVELEVVQGGEIVARKMARINKPSDERSFRQDLSWQFWGGHSRQREYDNKETAKLLLGLSLSGAWQNLDWDNSLYRNGHLWTQEGRVKWPLWDNARIELQNLFGSNGNRRWMGMLDISLPGGMGSLWYTRERSEPGRDVRQLSARDSDSAHLSLALSKWWKAAGTLGLSYERERNTQQHTTRLDYRQTVYQGGLGSMDLQMGSNWSRGGNVNQGNRQLYAALSMTLALGSDFSLGVSRQGDQSSLDLSASHRFSDGLLKQVGLSASKDFGESARDDVRARVYADYAGRYGSGSGSWSGAGTSQSLNLSHRGSLAWSPDGLAAGGSDREDVAAVVIQLPEVSRGELEAEVDGRSHPLESGANVLSLPAFKEYRVAVRNTKSAASSYQVSGGEHTFMLYPGNVVNLKPAIKTMVTVFGRLAMADGSPLRHARVQNHIGMAQSDDNGYFSIDVDRAFPELRVESAQAGEVFDVRMELKTASTAVWLGDVVWRGGDTKPLLVKPLEAG